MSEATIIVCDDKRDIASHALDLLVAGLQGGLARRGEAHLALTGGSSASALFELLRTDPRAWTVDWSRVHVWQGDERFVPPGHPERNWSGALRDWLAADGGPAAVLHPVPVDAALSGGHDAAWAAARYADEVTVTLPAVDGVPAFDVVLLGVGADGHILSTFPGGAAVVEQHVPVMAVAAPTHIEPHLPRVTLAPYLLRVAGSVVVMVPGAGKAEAVADVMGSPYEPSRLPAQLAVRPNATWLLEPGSAARL